MHAFGTSDFMKDFWNVGIFRQGTCEEYWGLDFVIGGPQAKPIGWESEMSGTYGKFNYACFNNKVLHNIRHCINLRWNCTNVGEAEGSYHNELVDFYKYGETLQGLDNVISETAQKAGNA